MSSTQIMHSEHFRRKLSAKHQKDHLRERDFFTEDVMPEATVDMERTKAAAMAAFTCPLRGSGFRRL